MATLKGQYDLADIIETKHVSTATPGDFKANNRPDHAAEKRRKKRERERERVWRTWESNPVPLAYNTPDNNAKRALYQMS